MKLAQAALWKLWIVPKQGLLWLVVIHQLSQPVPNGATLGVAWQLQQLEKRRASTRPARRLQHNEPRLPFGFSCCRQESRNHVQSYFIQLYSPVIRLSWTCQAWLPRGETKGFLSSVRVHPECCCKRFSKHVNSNERPLMVLGLWRAQTNPDQCCFPDPLFFFLAQLWVSTCFPVLCLNPRSL